MNKKRNELSGWKVFICTIITSFVLVSLCGCSHKGECDECGQYEKLNEFKDNSGEVRYYCDDCYSMAKLFAVAEKIYDPFWGEYLI